eukprot:TRINITY_DN16850_c0_g1_i1.p1 TRINITY_DN16850_c0_g1~~TRINITY_DN16850_c0_g1_i1.p1  ORF type:complete len:243 (+),score=15.03 TRINITY_DN16850_c0_g1_i1:78-806(+)
MSIQSYAPKAGALRSPIDKPHTPNEEEIQEEEHLLNTPPESSGSYGSYYAESVHFSIKFKWVITLLVGAALVGSGFAVAFLYNDFKNRSKSREASTIVGFAPLTAALTILALPILREHFRAWLNHYPFQRWRFVVVPIYVTVTCILFTGLQKVFAPTSLIFIFVMSFLMSLSMQEKQEKDRISNLDAIVWMLLWLPLRTRWFFSADGDYLDYQWWCACVSILILLFWDIIRPVFHIQENPTV